MNGVVKWFNEKKGYGFIAPEGSDKDVFVHHTAILGSGFKTLHEGDKVIFNVVEDKRGNKAVDVERTT